MSADSHALATISARPTVTMTFVVQTAAAREAAKANGYELTSLDRFKGIAFGSDHIARACAEKLVQAATQ
jgi:hypothetical protein